MPDPAETPSFEPQEFDEWAAGYDAEIERASGFPFEGYPDVLDEMERCAGPRAGLRVLDLGTGTGSLALRFHALGCEVWGTDFSEEMLELARRKVQDAEDRIHFLRWDVRDPWPDGLPRCFDRIVSAYTLHHFPLEAKIELLQTFFAHLNPGGRIAIGDIGFETRTHLDRARRQYAADWDEEYYWVADETLPALAKAGWQAVYQQISSCAGVYSLRR